MNFQHCDVKLDLNTVAKAIRDVLVHKTKKYSFYRVKRLWHDRKFPILEVYFHTKDSVMNFLKAKEEAEEDMKQAVLSLLESSCHTTPCPTITVNALLYLMHPQKGIPRLLRVTEKNFITEYKESFLFEFQDQIFSSENIEG